MVLYLLEKSYERSLIFLMAKKGIAVLCILLLFWEGQLLMHIITYYIYDLNGIDFQVKGLQKYGWLNFSCLCQGDLEMCDCVNLASRLNNELLWKKIWSFSNFQTGQIVESPSELIFSYPHRSFFDTKVSPWCTMFSGIYLFLPILFQPFGCS